MRVFAVERLADLTKRDLDEVCGTVTVARGLAYAKQGRVVDLELGDEGTDALGWVGGSAGQTYRTEVSLRPVTGSTAGRMPLHRWHSQCTCPMVSDCKHAVAVAATVRDRAPVRDRVGGAGTGRARSTPTAEPPPPTWERALGGLLDDLHVEEFFDDVE